MRLRELTVGIGTLALAVSASYARADAPAPMSDSDFVRAVQKGNDQEISDARYILGNTNNAEVRRFANLMISDHSSANVALLKAARNAHVPVPQGMRRTNIMTAPDALRGLSGQPLTSTYLQDEINGHQKMLAMLQAEEKASGADPALVAYANYEEPIVQKHLDAANNIVNVGSQATPGPILSSSAPNTAPIPSPITTQQTNGGAPTAVPVSVPGPTNSPVPGTSPRPTPTVPAPGPSHAP